MYSNDSPKQNNTWGVLKEKRWNLESVTGSPCYHANMMFSNLPNMDIPIASVCKEWR